MSDFSELDGIVDQVDQNLSQAQRIPHQARRNVGSGLQTEFKFLLLRLQGHDRFHVSHHLLQREIDGFHVQPTRLDF